MRHSLHARQGCLLIIAAIGLSVVGCDRTPEPAAVPGSLREARPEGDPRLPGVARVDEDLQQKLDATLELQEGDYVPRTHHLERDGSPRFTNRLILESSPYLLQHAHNPVNWYPWSDEAFERAKRENKPVFLSIGYSTCHWCHVMERESFEDEEIAAFLNRHFIAIKVDREERPDVDSVYMTAVQILTGRGGWPMTVIMTPDKDPFFGGTYFPPRKGMRGSRAGLIDILTEMVRLYEQEPTRAVQQAQELSQRVAQVTTTFRGAGVPSDQLIVGAAQRLAAAFDPVDGGFGRAPKFPQPARLAILLHYARRTEDPGALHIVTTTLDKMAAGGMYDHLGGGFHRYSTDGQWLVPHFEKMLYDNAQLASVYLDAWQLTGNPEYQRVARDILDYVAAEMTSPEGGFYSATDADSPTPGGHDEEGWFFTWTSNELEQLLGKKRAAIVGAVYGVTPVGNFEGRNILHRDQTNREVAYKHGITPKRVAEVLAEARPLLHQARASRPPPVRDEKVIAAWNGLMISAFARGAWALGEPRYAALGTNAARFVWGEMRDGDGALLRTYKGGQKSSTAFLDDYAFMVAACLDLYEATADAVWLERALRLQTIQDARYADAEEGGYFMTPNDGEVLLVREKPANDGAVPSGNSVAALNLLRLHDFTDKAKWREQAEALFTSLAGRIQRAPSGYPELLLALDYYYDVPLEIAVVAETDLADTIPLTKRLRETFVPNKVFCVLTDATASEQQRVVPWLEGKRALQGKPTAYVCERGRCDLPTSIPTVFQRQIGKRRPYPSYAETALPRLPVDTGRPN
ncbi:MAG: thioredoxin domain-containing protein [Myxococcales bacterium]|nr:thioredoxin domain-containing protein [Myxococcales bacterium]MDH3483137.1 thioredoxin domain-containing protein [Myxococcales bacterium]